MTKKLFVGNLPWDVRDAQLQELFQEFGEIVKAEVVMDRFDPNKSRGFGFVEFTTEEAAQAALAVDGREVGGRPIKVAQAQENQR